MPGFASGSPCLFQFTPLREGRQFVTPGFTGVPISIHAPPRGATGACASLLVRVVAFQFTPLREGRRCRRPRKWFSHHFNSRPSARGDGETTFCPTSRQHFNSRPSARGDVFCGFPTTFALQISIHAPPRGATKRHLSNKTREIFQFTPLREGRRHRLPRDEGGMPHFNSRPSARGDEGGESITASIVLFQFTPLREGRLARRG